MVIVKKVECANHATKCLHGSLIKLTQESPSFKGKGRLTKLRIKRMVWGVQLAISTRSQSGNVDKLREDFRSIIRHAFGDCSKCSPDICKTADKDEDENEEGNKVKCRIL